MPDNEILRYASQYFLANKESLPIAEEIVALLVAKKISYFVANEALEIAKEGIKTLIITQP